MIGIIKQLPGSSRLMWVSSHRRGRLNLAAVTDGLTKSAAFWSGRRLASAALRPALVAAAAITGYVIFMPVAQHQALLGTGGEQPQWAGHIEAPAGQEPQQSAPVTSASYAAPESALASALAKRTDAAAVMPKTPFKQVALPPRRPASNEDQTHVATAIGPAPAVTAALMPAETIPPDGSAPVRSRGLLSPVTDRLPTRGMLLKPLHVVGDAFHNLIRSF